MYANSDRPEIGRMRDFYVEGKEYDSKNDSNYGVRGLSARHPAQCRMPCGMREGELRTITANIIRLK